MTRRLPIAQFLRNVGLVFVAVLVSSCASAIAEPPATLKSQARIDSKDLAQRIHRLINDERAKHKLRALGWDGRLAEIALVHSRDMAKRNYLAHDSPEGHGFDHRYRQGRYNCEVRLGNVIHKGAENIALSRLYNSTTTINGVAHHDWNSADTIARRTVDGWMNSTGHRKNILTPHWRQEGIGIEVAPDNRVLVTQNFC